MPAKSLLKNVEVALQKVRMVFVDDVCGWCLWMVFVDGVCGWCLWMVFVDDVCG
jgi:hypothetical protein